MFCPLETLKANTIWIMISIKIRNHFRCCCCCALENLFLVKSSFAAFRTCHAFWTEALKHPPRSWQFFTSYTQSHSIIVLLLIHNIFKTFKGEVVFWQNSRQFLCCCKTLDSLRVRRRFKKQATCLFRFFLVFLLFLSSSKWAISSLFIDSNLLFAIFPLSSSIYIGRAWKRITTSFQNQLYHRSTSFASQYTIESRVYCSYLPNLVKARRL